MKPKWKEYKAGIRIPKKGKCVICGIDFKHHIRIETDGTHIKCVMEATFKPGKKLRFVYGSGK